MSAAAKPEAVEVTEPSEAVSRRWIVAFVLALIGVAAGWYGPIQILLPAQAERIAALGGKEGLLALVTGLGAAVSMIANPLWGAWSDRMRTRWGRRIPILVLGCLIGSLGLVVLGLAPDPTWMVIGWAVVQLGLNGPYAMLAAVIADRVPERQRGMVSALFGVAQLVGVVAGTAVAVAAGEGSVGYLAIAIAVPALVAAFVVIHREPVVAAATAMGGAPAAQGRDLGGFLRGLKPTAVFAWVWTIRFLLNFVNALTVLYLYYYLSDGVKVDDPGTWVLVITLLNVVVTAIAASVAGPLSDRWERRRVFVVAGAIVLAVGAGLMALLPVLPVVLVAASVTGIGWGLYMAVDMAILTKVLPATDSNATMLGIGNIAAALPQVAAPAIAAVLVVNLGGYASLYGVAALVSLAAVALVPLLRGLR